MTCSRELVEALADEELGPELDAQVREHLAGCFACAEIYARIEDRRKELRPLAYAAPESLRQSVHEALRREAAAGSRQSQAPWRWLAIAASIFCAVSLAWNVTQSRRPVAAPATLADNILTSHIRSLMESHLVDVESTDRHTVKPWFTGKLDFSPQVKDLADEGFPLAGGRLDYLPGHTVAALVYHRRKHVINVFTWPASAGDAAPGPSARGGYNLLHWTDGGMNYWAVSDIPLSELEQFAALFRR